MTLPVGASFREFMSAYMTFLGTVRSQADSELDRLLRLYRWKKDSMETPCIFNWAGLGASTFPDTARVRNAIVLTTHIAVEDSEREEAMDDFEKFVDVFRERMAAESRKGQPLGGACKWLASPSMELVQVPVSEGHLLAARFTVTGDLDIFNP